MQDFAGNNLVGTIPYFVVETFNQPLRRHWNLLRRSCATTWSGLKFLKHADSTPSTHFLNGGADTPLTIDLSSRKVRHDIRGEKFTRLYVVPPIAMYQQFDAGVSVLSDQVDSLGHGSDKPRRRSASRNPRALPHEGGGVASK